MNIKKSVVVISLDIMREELRSIQGYNTNDSVHKKSVKPRLDAQEKALRLAILTLGHFGGTHPLTTEEQKDIFKF